MVNILDGTSGDHRWHERRERHLKIESGEAVVEYHCRRCGRDIVTVLSTGAHHAVYTSPLCFYRLERESDMSRVQASAWRLMTRTERGW